MKHLQIFIICLTLSFHVYANEDTIWYIDETGKDVYFINQSAQRSIIKEVDTAYIRQIFNDTTFSMNERMDKIDSVFGVKMIDDPFRQIEQDRKHSENKERFIVAIIATIAGLVIALTIKQRKK